MERNYSLLHPSRTVQHIGRQWAVGDMKNLPGGKNVIAQGSISRVMKLLGPAWQVYTKGAWQFFQYSKENMPR